MSACHCSRAVPSFNILVGEHDLGDDSDGTIHEVDFYYEHPNYYSAASSGYDFVIITLVDRVVLGDVAIHACLPTEEMDDDYLSEKVLTVSGWGTLSSGGSQPSVLHTVDVPLSLIHI